MQPSITSRYECAGNSIGSIDAATSDDTEHGLTGIWMRRGQANARTAKLSFFWWKQRAEFSMPTTINCAAH
jgi:hypothetical protein